MENLQSELEYLVSQQKELESLLQTEKGEHAQTRAYLQVSQARSGPIYFQFFLLKPSTPWGSRVGAPDGAPWLRIGTQ